jgi:hypothetical protein
MFFQTTFLTLRHSTLSYATSLLLWLIVDSIEFRSERLQLPVHLRLQNVIPKLLFDISGIISKYHP